MHALIQDVHYAARTLRRNPGFTAIAVLALALGIGANTAVFTVVNGVLLRPMPFPEPDRLFLVSYAWQHGPFDAGFSMADEHYIEFRRQDRLFDHVASFTGSSANLSGAGDPAHIAAANVTPEFFSALRVNPAMGRTFLADEDQPGRNNVALLSDTLWRNRFDADSRIIGKTVTLDGVRRTVIGVMPAGFAFPYDAAVWTPLTIEVNQSNSFSRPVIGRLKAGVSPQQALAELKTFAHRLPVDPRDKRDDRIAAIVPLKELLVDKIRLSLWIFAGAVGFVLLIACVNVANLLLARAADRRPEMAVRSALGAGRRRLIRQLLTESTLVSLAGGIAGILLALWGVPALIALAPAGKIPRIEQIRIDYWVLAFTAGVSVVTGLLFGMAPALRATRRDLRETMSHSGRTSTGRGERLRSTLVVAEISLALILLTGAGLMLKSFLRLRAVDPGFHAENVLTMTVELPDSIYRTAPQIQAFHHQILAKLAALPGAVTAGAVNWKPLGGMLTVGDFQVEGGRRSDFNVDKLCVNPAYFRALGIRLEHGREFTESDNAAAPAVAIVSQSVARRVWPGEDPIGERVAEEDNPKPEDWITIVGVVDDIRQTSMSKNPEPALYRPYLQVTSAFWLNQMTFAVRTASNPQQLAAAMRAVLHDVDRDQPVMAMSTMQEMVATSTAEPRFQTRLLGVFALLALALAVVGIYGVFAYSVAQRTHEIGIRMALGAEAGNVLRMVLRRTLLLTGAGVALGTLGALAVTRALAAFLFEVKPNDPATFAAVAFMLVCVALAAGWIPARRATQVDPAIALRYE